MARIVIVGGYGAFGWRVAERLARDAGLTIIIAGRSAERAARASGQLSATASAKVQPACVDARSITGRDLAALGASIVINASGPFQAQDYGLARASIAAGAHYLDLADARAFVTGIGCLDAEARAAGVLVASGASSVPALAAAVIDEIATGLASIDCIAHGISSANSYDPGIATMASIVGAVGRPSRVLVDGDWQTRHIWQGLASHDFPGLGRRMISHCDVPDLDLFPARYPGVRTVTFGAGLEVGFFHIGMWALSWLCRAGLLSRPERLVPLLLGVKSRTRWLGSDAGGMFVTVKGRDSRGIAQARSGHIIARRDHGPYIPAMPSVIVARKLVRGEVDTRGSGPCLGLFTLEEFRAEVADLAIETAGDASRDQF